MKLSHSNTMKRSLTIATVLLATSLPIFSNPIALPMGREVNLDKEAVEISIAGNKASVTGTYEFKMDHAYARRTDYDIYLPVYAAKNTKATDITPSISIGGKALEVEHTTTQPFKSMTTVDGQVPVWFKARFLTGNAKPGDVIRAEISYSQALADGKFIYTPIIPKEEKGKDYGSITIIADLPLKLEAAKAHQFKGKGSKLIVEPHHLRSIIVSAGSKIP